MSEATFAMLCCAHGAEQVVKKDISAVGWRLAFSRPGFVTCKHDAAKSLPESPFVRTASRSIGQLRDSNGRQQIAKLIETLESWPRTNKPFDQVHVWSKDRAAIGRFGFEPGIDEVSGAVAQEVYQALAPTWVRSDAANRIALPDETVLDVVLVEPSHWFYGSHIASTWPTRWPGGVQPIDPKYEPISRAYFKAAEGISWSGFDLQPNDLAIEIGSAPGGACGRLLELGLRVIGIDPAEMDPRIMGHPNFRHIRARAGDLPRQEYRGAKWLLVDSNVKPDKTLITVGNIVSNRHSEFKGLLLTLKIGEYKSAGLIDRWNATIQTWNPREVNVRQLARNKCEVCFAVSF